MDQGLLLQVGAVGGVLGALWVLPDWPAYRERLLRVGRRLHLAEPELPAPAGPPIERIAVDVRRIRAQIRHAPPGMPVARMRGWLEAYDDVLADACHALGFEERLRELPEGPQRHLERERVERLLVRAGLLEPTAT